MRTVLLFVLAAAGTLLSLHCPLDSCYAQEAKAPAEMQAQLKAALDKQMQQAVQLRRVSSQQKMAIRIDDMHRVCNLSEAQTKRLQIAAKGAVDRSMEEWQKQFNAIRAQIGAGWDVDVVEDLIEPIDEVAGGEPIDEDGIEPAAEAVAFAVGDAVPIAAIEQLGFAFGGGFGDAFGGESPASQPIWTKTVKNTLTSEQQDAYDQALQERSRFQRAASVQQIVALVDRQLLLSNPQRLQLQQLIDQAADKSLVAGAIDGVEIAGLHLMNALGELPKAELKKFLSPAQMAQLKTLAMGPGGMAGNEFFFENGGLIGGWGWEEAQELQLDIELQPEFELPPDAIEEGIQE